MTRALTITALLLAASLACAEEEVITTTLEVEEVVERVAELEEINVTSEKPPVTDSTDDAELDAILEEAAALEHD